MYLNGVQVEWRDDGKTTPELRLKFWQFSAISQE